MSNMWISVDNLNNFFTGSKLTQVYSFIRKEVGVLFFSQSQAQQGLKLSLSDLSNKFHQLLLIRR